MHSLRIVTVLTASLTLLGSALAQDKPTPADASAKKLDEKVYDHFGAGITKGEKPVPLTEVMKDPTKYTGKKVRVVAPITGVCQTKGCWMTLGKPKEDGNPQLFVKFKDYGFFMPKDASGRTAIIEGTMKFKQETVAETKHYLEDAGKHDEAAKVTEGRKLYSFMADGVALAKPGKLDESRYDHFGAGIMAGEEPVALAEVMKDPTKYTGKKVRVVAPITGVCQTKGCWITLGKPKEDGNPQLFVKFKDYGFFMPKDASGRTAIIEGTMKFKQETVAETKHYLEDAGKHDEAKKVTEGRKLYSFMADGVALEKVAEKK